jgi:hypothetical protein
MRDTGSSAAVSVQLVCLHSRLPDDPQVRSQPSRLVIPYSHQRIDPMNQTVYKCL